MIGGHVAEYTGITHQPDANLNRTVQKMNALRGANKVSTLVTLGDTDWNATNLKARFGARRHIRYSKTAGAYYMMLDGGTKSVVVQKGFNGAPIGRSEPFTGKADVVRNLS
jgi:hypothetical protein